MGPLREPLRGRGLISEAGGIVGSAGAVYGWSMLGAAGGAAATTYRLLPAMGLNFTVVLAAAVSVLAGAAAFAAGLRARRRAVSPNGSTSRASGVRDDFTDGGSAFLFLTALGVSAFAATTFEIGWARLLAMVMGSSVYVYGTLGVVMLAGQGIGSAVYGRAQRTIEGHRRRFALLEFVIAFTSALSMIVMPRIPMLFLRFFPLFRDAFGRRIAAHFVAAALVALVPSLLVGATFPAAVGSLGGPEERFGRAIGNAYAANTMGMVAGACLAGLSSCRLWACMAH